MVLLHQRDNTATKATASHPSTQNTFMINSYFNQDVQFGARYLKVISQGNVAERKFSSERLVLITTAKFQRAEE